ncbi:MAG: NAD(P)/FAD-dependent oxidoreductase [Oscillospiraceae bacterium]|nr:NAD(P)/FAD-dependent oxidoreductase [Oscillospiraceae bacterium]
MTDYKSVAIVGGGASGMMAALSASRKPGRKVLLLERQQRIGRKLLSTGNGRCNLSNRNAAPGAYYGSEDGFSAPALASFSPEDTLTFFSELGLLTVTEASGRVYPLSDSSNSVLDVLRFALDRAGVELICSCPVQEIRRRSGFELCTETGSFLSDAVILACGGAAGSKVGGVTDGYRLARSLGHRRTSLHPSLTRILTDSNYPRSLKGIRVQAELRLTRNDQLIAVSRGEVQFTENGVSGPAGFDLSRAVSFSGDHLMLHLGLLPMTREEILNLLLQRCRVFPDLDASELFTGMLHNRLGRVLVKASSISASEKLSSLPDSVLRTAAACCTDFCLPVRGVEGFEAAQVTAGGLDCSDFDPDTMQSRLVPGLFACGELLDVDGPCGGYNLQWAWASGMLAGRLGS